MCSKPFAPVVYPKLVDLVVEGQERPRFPGHPWIHLHEHVKLARQSNESIHAAHKHLKLHNTYTHTCRHTHVYTHVYTHTHTHTHTHTQHRFSKFPVIFFLNWMFWSVLKICQFQFGHHV